MPSPNYPWAERFAELALRAMRRIHYDYGAWHLGQQWSPDAPELQGVNQGLGVAAADELTVCAAITQECITSQGFSGSWQVGRQWAGVVEGLRYWSIDREQYYSSGERVDFCIKRLADRAAPEKFDPETDAPCFIEAKRARRWSTASLAQPDFVVGPRLLADIKADIEKLRREIQAREGKLCGHLLIWDLWASEKDSPSDLLVSLADPAVLLHQVRWMPVAWPSESSQGDSPPAVKTWLWLGLFEVFPA